MKQSSKPRNRVSEFSNKQTNKTSDTGIIVIGEKNIGMQRLNQNQVGQTKKQSKSKRTEKKGVLIRPQTSHLISTTNDGSYNQSSSKHALYRETYDRSFAVAGSKMAVFNLQKSQINTAVQTQNQVIDTSFEMQLAGRQTVKRASINSGNQQNYFYQKSASLATALPPSKGSSQAQAQFFYQPLLKSSQSYLKENQAKDKNQGILLQQNYQQALKSQELTSQADKRIFQKQIYSQVDLLTAGTSVNDLNLMKITQNRDSQDYIKFNQKQNENYFNRQNYSGSILKPTQPNSSQIHQINQQEQKGSDIFKGIQQQSSQYLMEKNNYKYGIIPTGAKILHHISGRQALEQYRASDFSQIITSARDFIEKSENHQLQRNQLNDGSVMSSNHYQNFQQSQRQVQSSNQRIPESKIQYQPTTIHEKGFQQGRKNRPTTAKAANNKNKNVDIQMQGMSRGYIVQNAAVGGSTQASANQSQTFHHIVTNDSHQGANAQTRFQSPNPYMIKSRVTTTKATGEEAKTIFIKNKNRESLSGFSSQSGGELNALESASNKKFMNIKESKIRQIGGYTQGKDQILEIDEHESARNIRLQYEKKNNSIARSKSRKIVRRSGMNHQNQQIDRLQSNSQKSDCSIKSKKDQHFSRTFKQKKQSQGNQSTKNVKHSTEETQAVLRNLILNPSQISTSNTVGQGERNRILLLRQRTSQATSAVHFQNKHETKQTRPSSSQISIDAKQMYLASPSKGKNTLTDDLKRALNQQYPYDQQLQVFNQKSNTRGSKHSQSSSPKREIYESGNVRRAQSISNNEGATIDQRFNLKQLNKGQEQNSSMHFQATENECDDEQNQNIENLEERGRMSVLMKQLNSQLNKSLAYLDHFQTQRDPMMNKEALRISKYDCQAILSKAQKQIKIIQYKCNTTVAAENERILVIQPPGQNEGIQKGPERQLDIIEKCPLICKIDVKGRKAPLKFYINYETNVNKNKTKNNPLSPRASISPDKGNIIQIDNNNRPKTALQKQKMKRASMVSSELGVQSTNGNQTSNLYPDLTIFVSEDKKNPDEFNSFQQIKNPGAKFTIKLSENNTINAEDKKNSGNALNKLKANAQEKDCFKCKSLYLSLNSEKGCSIIVSCSFPSQGQKQGGAGGLYGDDDQKQIFMTVKDIKKKIQNKVDKDVGDLLGDELGQNQYFEHIQMLKNRRAAAGLKNAEINFLEQNIDNLREKEQIEKKKKELRDKTRERVEEAKMIREKIFEDKLKKAQFEMLKWELFRQKCDQIDERWSNFKKRQLKLLWWNQIMSTFFCAQRARQAFVQYRTKKIRDLKRKIKAFRIQFQFRKFLLRQGPNDFQRNRLYIRKCLSFVSNFKIDTAVQISKMYLKKFFGDKIEQNNIMGRFRSFHENCQFIQRKIKYEIKIIRESRIQSLNQFWDRERDRLLIYYRERSKKNKKLKSVYNSLVKITESIKFKILIESYYEQKVFYQNLQASILLQAQIEVRRGAPEKMVHKSRIFPMTKDQSPFYTDQEYKNLVDIERQLIAVNTFLFKGTKDTKCIGEKDGHNLYDLERKVVKVKKVFAEAVVAVKKVEPVKKKKKDQDEVEEEEKDEMDNEEDQNSMGGDKDSEKDEMDSPRASKSPDQRANDVIEQGGNETKKGKGKAVKESAIVANTSSAAKKGGSKKKKKKEVEIKLPRDFDMNDEDGRKQCLPSRAIMQKMIMRAAQLKKNEEGPHFLEIRPWVVKLRKELNADILLD